MKSNNNLKFGKFTDIGTKRLENQDRVAIFCNEQYYLLILCDGMGGHFGGALAASTTINTFETTLHQLNVTQNLTIDETARWIEQSVRKARKEMEFLSLKDAALIDMGTTVTGVLINSVAKTIVVFNIGDSRIYTINKDNSVNQITKDHNLYNSLIEKFNYTHKQAIAERGHRALTSSLGPTKKTKINISDLSKFYDEIEFIFATSDGVHNFVSQSFFELIFINNKDDDLDNLAQDIVQEALLNKSNDNLSIGIIKLKD
ncbi:PP2C family protein-serine/threonine phosphatase [Mycoplasmopsis gallinarum]